MAPLLHRAAVTILGIELYTVTVCSVDVRLSLKTKQSLALKLMAIYTLKSNILVYFSNLPTYLWFNSHSLGELVVAQFSHSVFTLHVIRNRTFATVL